MNGRAENHEQREMKDAVDKRQRRRETWKREGERSLWQNLSMVGSLGWLVVVPTLLGVLAGRWLDTKFGTGIFYSGALIFLGVAFGSWLAWKRIDRE